MGKYDKLGRNLAKVGSNKLKYSFEEIEEMLGFSLPKSARLYRPWWANDDTHVQASDGWLSYGWVVSFVDMEKEEVALDKVEEQRQMHTNKLKKQFSPTTPREFEDVMRTILSKHYKTDLFPGKIQGVPKLFDMVSEDKMVVGDAKYMTMVRGKHLPPAKFSVIAEHVWLLEKVNATNKFLVFGNDRRVPEEWLRRYGKLVADVDFFFYDTKNNQLEKLNDNESAR